MLTLLESHFSGESVHIAGTSSRGSALSGQQSFSRFVKFQLGNFAVGCANWDLNGGSVLLGGNNLLDMEAPSSSVDGHNLTDLAFNAVLHGTDLNLDSVSSSDWKRSA